MCKRTKGKIPRKNNPGNDKSNCFEYQIRKQIVFVKNTFTHFTVATVLKNRTMSLDTGSLFMLCNHLTLPISLKTIIVIANYILLQYLVAKHIDRIYMNK